MNLDIITSDETTTSTIKHITFTHEGNPYRVLLFWDTNEGYNLQFIDGEGAWISAPDWVTKWEESQQYGAESLEYTLDSLSNEVKA